jgi:hypothetical protein
MPTDTETQVTQDELKVHKGTLEAALQTVDDVLNDKDHTIDDLKGAVAVLHKAYMEGNERLYEKLKIGRACLTREFVEDSLKIETKKELKQTIKKYRKAFKDILKTVTAFISGEQPTKEPEPKPTEPVEPTPPKLASVPTPPMPPTKSPSAKPDKVATGKKVKKAPKGKDKKAEVKAPDLFEEVLKKDKGLKYAVDMLKTAKRFRNLTGDKIRLEAALRGALWRHEYCSRLQSWLNSNTDVGNLIAKETHNKAETEEKKRAVLNTLKTLEKVGLDENLHMYLQASPENIKKRKERTEKKLEEERKRLKKEKQAKEVEEKAKLKKEMEPLLKEHPVLLEVTFEFVWEKPQYLKLFQTAWQIFKGKKGQNLNKPDRDKIMDFVSDLVETSKIDSKGNRTAIRDDLEELLEKYKDILKKATGEEPPPKPPSGGGAPPSEKKKETVAKTTKETPPPSGEKAPEGFDKKVQNLMAEILKDPTFYNEKKDPASLVIRELLEEIDEKNKFSELKGFLLNSRLNLTAKVDAYAEKSIPELELMLKEQGRKEKEINIEISGIDKLLGGRGTIEKKDADAYLAKQAGLQRQLSDIENEKEAIDMAIDYKNNTTRYISTTRLLAMINCFIEIKINKKKPPARIDVSRKIKGQIDQARKQINKTGKALNLAFGFMSGFTMLKPTLPATMENLVKDEHLSKIGAEKLKRLAKVWDNKGAVAAWINSLEGSEEDKITKIVPRIIAYLEMALRDGNIRYINGISAHRAETLVMNLEAIRDDYIDKKIEHEMSGSQHKPIDRINAFFKELDYATVTKNEVTEKLIKRRAKLRVISAAGGVGLLAGGLGKKLGIIPETTGHKELDEATKKTKKEESVRAWRRGTGRFVGAAALGVGAALLTGGALLPALAAVPGVFSPEIIKHRKEIGEKGLAAGKVIVPKAASVAKFGLLTGLSGGIYAAYKAKEKLTSGSSGSDLPLKAAA